MSRIQWPRCDWPKFYNHVEKNVYLFIYYHSHHSKKVFVVRMLPEHIH
jgi:hypothetical protein